MFIFSQTASLDATEATLRLPCLTRPVILHDRYFVFACPGSNFPGTYPRGVGLRPLLRNSLTGKVGLESWSWIPSLIIHEPIHSGRREHLPQALTRVS
jgi:hypothetical protein